MVAFIAILFLWAIIAYVMYLNRSADKILEAMVVVTLAMITSLVFVLKSEEYEKDVFPAYFYNVRLNELIPILGSNAYRFEGMLLRDYQNANKDKTVLNIEKVLPNLLEKTLVDWFCMKGAWPTQTLTANVGNLTSFKGLWAGKAIETKIEAVEIFQDDLKKLMRGNIFASYFNHPAPLRLPTKMKLIIERKERSSQIIFKDRFCTITLVVTVPVAGSIIQDHFPISKFLEIPKEDLDGTYVALARINMKATFNWLLAGNPEMSAYKTWVDDKFDQIEADYSWDTRRQLILENILVDLGEKINSLSQ